MKIRNLLLTSAAVLFCAASISAATTTSAHTWVSGSGSDSNPCTFASPCATFQGALTNTTAGGMITAKDAGDFGAVTINKSVTIDGANMGSITSTGESLIFISTSVNVTVQNLTINGLGSANYGIAADGGIVIVDNCRIMNITFDGIYFNGAGNLTVENSRIESFIGEGVYGFEIYSSAAENVVVRNTVIDASPNSVGHSGFVVNPGAGPVMASLQDVTIMGAGSYAVWTSSGVTEITGSVLTQSWMGVYADEGATISVASSLITANTIGVCSNTSSKIRLDNNDIYDNPTAIDNTTGVVYCGGIVKTSGTNKTSGTIAIPPSDVSNSVTF
jgi:hypothetical protein